MKRILLLALLALTFTQYASARLNFLITPVDSISRKNLKETTLTVSLPGDTNIVCEGTYAIYYSGTKYELHRKRFELPRKNATYDVRISAPEYITRTVSVTTTKADGDNSFIDLGEYGLLREDGIYEQPEAYTPMRYELMMMEKEYVPLVESKALTDETT